MVAAVEGKPTDDRGSLLVVDDNQSVIDAIVFLLRPKGRPVLTARTAREAVEVFKANADRIAVVLLDLTMPDLDGMTILRLLREHRENVPVLIMSGYSESDVVQHCEGATGFIQKPFQTSALMAKIDQALQG